MKRLILTTLVAVALLCGCAGMSPEAKLKAGFDTVTASANTATRLLDTRVISSDQAQRIYAVGSLADQSLKAGEQRLLACRAAEKPDCSGAVADIDMGSGLLLELEKYLEAQQLQKGP